MNFWSLFTFGYQFAPRYADLHKKMNSLVGRLPPKHYGNWMIKPARKSNDELIVREWSSVQRIMASLAQKDVSQATIVRKLSSYTRQNQTKKALWELDNLCRTRYILTYMNDVKLTSGCAEGSQPRRGLPSAAPLGLNPDPPSALRLA